MCIRDSTGVDQVVWRGLADLGTTGLLVPEENGGAGMTMVEAGIVAEELGAALHPGPWLSSAVAATRALTRLGGGVSANDGAGKILAGIADGTTVATVGFLGFGNVSVEVSGQRDDIALRGAIAAVPDAAAADVLLVLAQDAAGTALFAVNTASVVEAAGEGDGIALRGEIAAVPDAAAADILLVLALDAAGMGLFAVNTDASGVSVQLEHGIDQTRKRFRVTLDDAPAHRLATPSPEAIEAVIDDVLIATAADALGAAQAVMNLSLIHISPAFS